MFKLGQPMLICGNTAAMLTQTHLAPHFRVVGDTSTHYGMFDCGPGPQQTGGDIGAGANGACC